MLTIAGYLDTLSAAPGETVAVKVGSYGARRYRADLVRIIVGDRNPDGPGEVYEPVPLDLGGERAARVQPIRPGSHVMVPDRGGVLADIRDFTLAVPVLPTRIGPDAATVAALSGTDLRLWIDDAGHPAATVHGATIVVPRPLRAGAWAVLVVSLDAAAGALRLTVLDETGRPTGIAESPVSPGWSAAAATGMMFAASAPGAFAFDGKIDSPALFSRELAAADAFARLLRRRRWRGRATSSPSGTSPGRSPIGLWRTLRPTSFTAPPINAPPVP